MSPKTHPSGLLSVDFSLLSKSLEPSRLISPSERTKWSSLWGTFLSHPEASALLNSM